VLFLVSIVAGGFGELFVPSKLIVSADATATANNMLLVRASTFRNGKRKQRLPGTELRRRKQKRYGVDAAAARLRDHPAASSASKACLASGPPRYSPMVPSLRTTRWQGTTSGNGLWEHALAAARTADGLPAAFATAV
jgi:hypothetical protein